MANPANPWCNTVPHKVSVTLTKMKWAQASKIYCDKIMFQAIFKHPFIHTWVPLIVYRLGLAHTFSSQQNLFVSYFSFPPFYTYNNTTTIIETNAPIYVARYFKEHTDCQYWPKTYKYQWCTIKTLKKVAIFVILFFFTWSYQKEMKRSQISGLEERGN